MEQERHVPNGVFGLSYDDHDGLDPFVVSGIKALTQVGTEYHIRQLRKVVALNREFHGRVARIVSKFVEVRNKRR